MGEKWSIQVKQIFAFPAEQKNIHPVSLPTDYKIILNFKNPNQ